MKRIFLGGKELIINYDKLGRICLIRNKTAKSISNMSFKYRYLNTKIIKDNKEEIYSFNNSGNFIKKEVINRCRKS